MKKIILSALLLVSSNAFALATLKGKFELANTKYELTYTYDVASNQVVSSQQVRIIDDARLPESTETLPAYCMFEMSFPASYLVTIKNASTQEVVYVKEGTELFSTSVYGGLVEAKECEWNVSKWKAKVPGMLRITDWSFVIKEKSYRYFMDTNVLVDAQGNSDGLVVAKATTPIKGSSGKDGEVWLDTQPTANGHYDRTWFPLSL